MLDFFLKRSKGLNSKFSKHDVYNAPDCIQMTVKYDYCGSRKIDQTIAFIFRIKDADFVRHEIDSVSPIFYT